MLNSLYKKFLKWAGFEKLLLLLLGLLALGQLQRFELLGFGAIYLHDLLLGGWVIWMASEWWQRNSLSSLHQILERIPTIIKATLAWLSLGWLISLVEGTFDLQAAAYILRISVYLSWLVLLWPKFKVEPWFPRLMTGLVGVVIAAWGIIGYLIVPDTRFLAILGWDDHYYRLLSTQFDPNFTGLILVLSIFYIWSWNQYPDLRNCKPLQKLRPWLILVLGIALSLTFSRISYLALLLGGGVLILQKPRMLKMAVIIIFISLGALIISPKPSGEGVKLLRTASIEARFSQIQNEVKILKPRTLLVGNGLFVTPKSAISYQGDLWLPNHAQVTDNLFLTLIKSSGLIGLGLAITLIIWGWKSLSLKDRWITSSLLAILIHSQANNSLFQPFILLWFLLGILSLPRIKKGKI